MSFELQQNAWSASPRSISQDEALDEVKRLLGENLPTSSLFAAYKPLRDWFARPAEIANIHGIAHEARVMIWQEILARLLIKEGVSLDQEALRWAAATHDLQRLDDGSDFPHGKRAAAWVERNLKQRLPEATLKMVMYLDTWHVPADVHAPAMTPELAVFKDADSLDRVRIYDLDPQYLRWDYSKNLLQYLAQALFMESEARRQPGEVDLFEVVIEAAVALGLVRA
ncbi:hypothetical protein EPA93_08270 [Ktedonosporobacter rubrisoli]|uniref:HD domain-containing protein n=1 Tax=Ktedonosporobacter rubrisoli TaxID=2509675 RepID=A0A4P6JLT9_KTERU|nr:HD domain-containing protein [Ktedonosporobacter rubrisoli]QBD76000.1 hypothetical protein EPA93_08270 [Ktedonosporobacter rubrisoli]